MSQTSRLAAVLVLTAIFAWSQAASASMRAVPLLPSAPALDVLYPDDEYCLFVPPPDWLVDPEITDLQQMLADRSLALETATWLGRMGSGQPMLLSADEGLNPAVIAQGGAILERMASRNGLTFHDAWRQMRKGGVDGRPLVASPPLSVIDRLCPRRAVLVLTIAERHRALALVYSLITGNLLAQGQVTLPGPAPRHP